ncbi:MAG: YwiC-like family protein [bacterium]|nr:YwiC-like family protein [bacterium]
MTTSRANPNQRKVIRSVALPTEHGGWGFLIEPIILGLLVAFSGAGLLLAISAFGVFLIHQPLKIAIKDRMKGNRPPRTILAERFALGYGGVALIPFGILLLLVADKTFLLPLVIALPFALVQLWYDAKNQSRKLLPEVCGAIALGAIAPMIAILGGWAVTPALILWLFLMGRIIPSILYVRARLRLERGNPIQRESVWMVHGVAVIMVIGFALSRTMPYLGVVAMLILLGRAMIGLSDYRKARRAPIIGFQELGYGFLTALLGALGYALGW